MYTGTYIQLAVIRVYLYIYGYVCTYIYVYIYMYIHFYTKIHISISTYILYIYIFIYLYTYTCTHIHALHTYIDTQHPIGPCSLNDLISSGSETMSASVLVLERTSRGREVRWSKWWRFSQHMRAFCYTSWPTVTSGFIRRFWQVLQTLFTGSRTFGTLKLSYPSAWRTMDTAEQSS